MSTLDLYSCTPRETRSHIIDCLFAGNVPFVKSSPGTGKSSLFNSVAKELRLKVIDHRLSTSAPEDLSGLPRFDDNGNAYFSPFADLFPLEDTPLPEGYDGWLLFLDEANSAPKEVLAAAYKLVLDKMTGQKKLHPRVAIAMAGNLMNDRAIVNNIGTALQSRVVHINMRVDHKEWLEDVALVQNYDSRLIAFLNYKPDYLMDFDPNHSDETFCCPRTWEFMNNFLKNMPAIPDSKGSLFAGTITSGKAIEFVQFAKVQDSMISVKEILRDPAGAHVPGDNATKWMVISHMMSQVTEDNFDSLCTYANRFDATMRVLFYRSTMVRHPELRAHPAFTKAMIELSRYLHD